MEEERDIVTFSDDEGNEFELEVIDYFDYEDQEYAVLIDPATSEDEESDETEVYIMKVVVNGEYEEFLPADEDKMDELTKIAEERIASWDEEGCECDCDHCHEGESDDEDSCGCGCGCDHDHH